MKFRTLLLDDISIKVQEYYSLRIDRSLVFQLERQITSSLINKLESESINIVEVCSQSAQEKIDTFFGPFKVHERNGVLILEKE